MTSRSQDRTDSADGAFVITPSDTDDLKHMPVALNVRTSGVVMFIGADGRLSDVFIAAGVAFPIRVQRVMASGTTATGIRGLV